MVTNPVADPTTLALASNATPGTQVNDPDSLECHSNSPSANSPIGCPCSSYPPATLDTSLPDLVGCCVLRSDKMADLSTWSNKSLSSTAKFNSVPKSVLYFCNKKDFKLYLVSPNFNTSSASLSASQLVFLMIVTRLFKCKCPISNH